jgi:hypothetical protein
MKTVSTGLAVQEVTWDETGTQPARDYALFMAMEKLFRTAGYQISG